MNEFDTLIEKFTLVNKIRIRIIKEIETHMEDINFTDYILLKKIIREKRDLSMTEVSELTGFSNTLITFTVDNLEKKGYVFRQKGGDRRTYYIKVTDMGFSVYNKLENTVAEVVNKIFQRIEPEDLDKLKKLMSELNGIIDKYAEIKIN
ncbi:MAG: MarR family winged helix-turn-helix transcriptional regulator [Thermoplasmata archaeon]